MTLTRRAVVASGFALPFLARADSERMRALQVSATPSVFRPMFEVLRSAFERDHPGLRVAITASARDQEQQILTTLRRHLIGDLPDVSFEGFRHLRMLARRRIGVPLDAWVASDAGWSKHYGRAVVDSAQVDGACIGLGVALSVPIIYYNANLVAGVLGSARLPEHWDGLLALIDALGKRAGPGALGGFIQHESSSWNYLAMLESLGGSMMNADESEIAFDDALGRRALAIHAAFGRAGQARMDMSREQARQTFAAGKIALMIDSSSSLAMLEKQIAGRFPLGTARVPLVPDGRLPASGIAAVMMTRDPARQAAAWQFIRYICGPAGQMLIGKSTGYLPANDIVVSRSDLLGSYYEARRSVRAVVESLPFATRWYAFPGDNSAKIDSVIANGVSSVISLSKSPDQALASMRRSVQALLPEART